MGDVKTAEESLAAAVGRRHFFVGLIYGAWALILAALGSPALAYLFFPPKAEKKSEWVEAGDVTKLATDTPVELVFRRNRIDGWRVISEKSTAWVVKRPDERIVAFGPQCTHLGCAYHWEEDKHEFICPCHSSLFSIEGKVLAGPAPRRLDRYDVKVEGGKLMVGALRESPEQTA